MAGDLPLFDPFKALEEIRRQGRRSTPPELPQKLPQPLAEAIREQDQKLKPTSATSAGGPSPHAVAHARVKEEERKNNIIISCTYARDEHAQGLVLAHAPGGVAEVAEAAEVSLSHSEKTITPKIEVAEVSQDGLRKWRRGLATLSPDRVPCPDYRGDEWARTLARALDFLDTFGVQAEALGWTTARLFGVHPEAGIIRVDTCGGLVLPGSAVRAITATEISFGHLTHYWKPHRVAGIPIWEFGR
jgi:co-chaperonin GroES (HSP10)